MMPEETAPTHFRACCRNVIQVLQKVGVQTPELDARLLISNALGLKGAAFFLEPDRVLSEDELNKIASRLARRMAGEPVSRIVGSRGFWKHEFVLGPEVLDPRPDSETLVEAALELIETVRKNKQNQQGKTRVLDLGTGSGALLISLLLEWPDAVGVGVDISEEALSVAEKNAAQLGCSERTKFLKQNWLNGLYTDNSEPFDLVICNPPYIPHAQIDDLAPEVRVFDPQRALDGGEDGLDPYREIIPQLKRVLTPAGIAIFEIGEGQQEAVFGLFDEAGLTPIGGQNGAHKDLAGKIRCLTASPAKGV